MIKNAFSLFLVVLLHCGLVKAESALPIKAVVLVNFEIGADSGDVAGEFQYWMERGIDGETPLTCLPLPMSTHAACLDKTKQVLFTYTGLTQDKAAASVMAMGLDPRFDFSQSYWLIGGIAGIDAEDGSLGSPVWGKWVVNGDWAHEIDAREMPESWQTGYLPFGRDKPYAEPAKDEQHKIFHINEALADKAYQLTKDTPLANNAMSESIAKDYTEQPRAQMPPQVMQGDNLSASTFWHGQLMNDWANDWVSYWSNGEAEFVTSAVEDSGILEAIRFLDQGDKADFDRVMLLRTASNFTTPPPGMDAATNLAKEMSGFGGMEIAVENHWRVGSNMINAIINHWPEWQDKY